MKKLIAQVKLFFIKHSSTYKRMEREREIDRRIYESWANSCKKNESERMDDVHNGMMELIEYIQSTPPKDLSNLSEQELMMYSYILGISKYTDTKIVDQTLVHHLRYLDAQMAMEEESALKNIYVNFNFWHSIYDFYLERKGK